MIQTMFRSEDLPPQDRLASLNEIFVNSVHPMRILSAEPEDFRATARGLDLAAVDVVELTCSTSEVLRTPRLIRRYDPELLCVVMAVQGGFAVSQSGRDAVLNAGELALYDSSRPFRLGLAAGGEAMTMVRAHMPREFLGLSADHVEPLLGRSLPGAAGVGGLLSQFLVSATAGSAAYRPPDLPRLGTVARDLLTALVAHHLDADSAVPDDSRRRTLLMRIDSFVRQHLHDPDLSPATIAAAHHISVGHLHRLFVTRDTTVAAWIRHQRLEHARRELTDPALHGVPVHRIAARWGFRDHPTFTRAFRTAYGTAPKDYRHNPPNQPLPT
ncbi:helix-turn-helix domain-containing protein [Actinacidiphila sp. ITFR-21]|uniref:helix-turn-helix domain-containing protein n=1 Tax=Actinacidiphila sp. ITFR-21 TaxID=3075199 RepID=UPI00288BEA68|nr:helix-turn-helix domain-containing protein [Streptomyces sp. ITFR-21]WNI18900.1 helix-turn-helix domain-containing protein [Streptomyces sp. ITFR-21]